MCFFANDLLKLFSNCAIVSKFKMKTKLKQKLRSKNNNNYVLKPNTMSKGEIWRYFILYKNRNVKQQQALLKSRLVHQIVILKSWLTCKRSSIFVHGLTAIKYTSIKHHMTPALERKIYMTTQKFVLVVHYKVS